MRDAFTSSDYDAAQREALHNYNSYLERQNKHRYVLAYLFASINAQLGKREQALAWLEKAYEERDVCLFCLRADTNSVFSGLREEPRYRAILKNIRFPD